MSKRLQVVVGDADLARYTHTADASGLTLSEWARQALGAAARRQSGGDVDTKLAAIRAAVGHDSRGGPEVDIDPMLAEIEGGRLAEIEAGAPGSTRPTPVGVRHVQAAGNAGGSLTHDACDA